MISCTRLPLFSRAYVEKIREPRTRLCECMCLLAVTLLVFNFVLLSYNGGMGVRDKDVWIYILHGMALSARA